MFLKPSTDGRYYGQQSQILRGLWTPYGIISPMFLGIWPDGSVVITYHMNKKAHFTKELNSKLNRTSQINRVDIMDEPFEKTASQKIKRFLYTKTKKKK
jgi:hypothetical protein